MVVYSSGTKVCAGPQVYRARGWLTATPPPARGRPWRPESALGAAPPAEGLPSADVEVIDLGAPRPRRSPRPPYPPASPAAPTSPQTLHAIVSLAAPQHIKEASGEPIKRRRCRKRVFRRTVPNSRLYRPGPPASRPPPVPPARPRAAWSPPRPALQLDTASSAALRLATARTPHLVVRLPPHRTRRPSPSPLRRRPSPLRRRPSPLRRRRSPAPGTSHAAPAPPAPPAAPTRPPMADSDNNDIGAAATDHTAPSEFLAEFLSAIMQRQYAEALKYCRLILQYEPQNATARGFYPLLQQKLRSAAGDSSGSAPASPASAASGASGASRWSSAVSLETSHSSPSAPRSASPASSSSASPAWPCDDLDDNGNAAGFPPLSSGDENDNSTLSRLRAQYACAK